MAVTFHVFVDGAVDASPDGLKKLATSMSARYGLPAADLVGRLSKGRFRVKANVDQQTADTYLRDLSAIGARCTIEPADGAAPRATTPPATATRATTPPATAAPRATTPPPTSALPPRGGAPRASTPPPAGGFHSGLAAAFSSESPAASLGALAGDLSSFSLGSVDGVGDEEAAPEAAFVPPPEPEKKAPAKQAAAKAPAKPAKPKDEPLDLFAPPDAQAEADFKVDLEPEEEERHARKRMSTPPPNVPAPAPAPAQAKRGNATVAPANEVVAALRERSVAPADAEPGPPRARFAAGVVLAIVIGFIPAHFVAAMREKSAFKSVDDKIELAQQEATTPDAYDALDRLRDEQLGRKASDQRSIMLMALAIWAVVGAGVAYVWFRRMPESR